MPLPGSWMPFPFAANVHQQYKILQPFNVASQLSGLVVGGPQLCLSCFAIHHLPSVLSPPWPHVCVTYTAWGHLCSCLSWLEGASSACCFLARLWKKADVTHLWEQRQPENGPQSSRTCWWLSCVSRKATSGREEKRKEVRGGMACGSRSPGRSENKQSHPDAQAESRCWNLKGNKKIQLVSYFFLFCRSGISQGVKM